MSGTAWRSAFAFCLFNSLAVASAFAGLIPASSGSDPIIDTTVPATGTTAPAGKDEATETLTLDVKNNTTGVTKPVTVTITVPKGTNRADKLQLIADALTAQGFVASISGMGVNMDVNTSSTLGDGTANPNANGKVTKTTVAIAPASGEADSVAALGGPSDGTAVIAYAGTLTGVDVDGAPATYTAGFGLDDGISIEASFSFGPPLITPTLDGLLTDMFVVLDSELPVDLRGDLVLDLATDSITFNLPGTTVDPFVNNGTTDVGLEADLSLTTPSAAPEPSGLVFVGLFGLAAVWRLKRARV